MTIDLSCFMRKFIGMKKHLMLLLLLPFAACKKNDEKQPDYQYEVVVKCSDCSFSVGDLDSKLVNVKGQGIYGTSYVPNPLLIRINSSLEEEQAKIIFPGTKTSYAALTVYEGIIFKQPRNIAKPLPPTR